jgi:hypothetical protein
MLCTEGRADGHDTAVLEESTASFAKVITMADAEKLPGEEPRADEAQRRIFKRKPSSGIQRAARHS